MQPSERPREVGSRSSLIIERHYVPRSAPSTRTSTLENQPTGEQPSPMSSINSHSPNGYMADYNSVSEVSSVTGSVSSMPMHQHLDASKLTYMSSRYQPANRDSRASGESAASLSSYGDTDLDSSAGAAERETRYRGELFQPKPAPRIVQRQVRQMYGEVHPKNLPTEELPTPSSGDELETMSEASIPSFKDVPKARPRASLRRKKCSEVNSGFVSDDDTSVYSQSDRSKSLPRGILKNSTDISDAESLAASGTYFRRTASGRTVRFQHNDKAKTIPKKLVDYEKIDSEDSGGKKKKRTSSTSDPFSVIKPMGIKPARNDPKRSSSGRSHQGRRPRSSSDSQTRSSSRQGSMSRGRSGSGRGRSSSQDNKKPTTSEANGRSDKTPTVSMVSGEEVKIQMDQRVQPRSMMQEMRSGSSSTKGKSRQDGRGRQKTDSRGEKRDTQKLIKWGLIIGIPVVLLIIVGVILGFVVRG